jgi:hypothetical protein
LTLGNGTQIAKYRRVGKTVDIVWQFILGSSSAVGTSPRFSLPADITTAFATITAVPLFGEFQDISSGAVAQAHVLYISASTLQMNYWSAALTQAGTTATAPWTWATGDAITIFGTYYTD